MEITHTSGSMERKLCTGMIVSTPFLAQLASHWRRDLFGESKFANIIGSWCIDYYNQFRKAPGRHIADLFQQWSDKRQRDKSTVQMIESLLQGLSGEYATLRNDLHPQFLLKQADKFFNQLQMKAAIQESQKLVEAGDLDAATSLMNGVKRINLVGSSGVDLLQDQQALQRAFDYPKEPMIRYTGDAAKFFGCEFERDGFVCFMASNKRGKSFALLDLAWRAMEQRIRVAYFQVGDLSERQLQQRFAVRAARRPFRAATIQLPREITRTESGVKVRHKSKIYNEPLDWKTAWQAYQDTMINKVKSKKPYLKYSVHPSYSINLNGIISILQTWEKQEEWIADCVVIDYMDVLAPISERKDARDQINENWLLGRRISQENHCLVVTATQAKSTSFTNGNYVLSRRDFADDRRKLDHVTAMIGINSTTLEEEQGVCRYNWINRRQDESKGILYVAGCKAIANPCILSCF